MIRRIHNYGIPSDDRLDAKPAVQRMIDALRPGDEAVLKVGGTRRYLFQSPVRITTPDVKVHFEDNPLVEDTSAHPENYVVIVSGSPGPAEVELLAYDLPEPLDAGAYRLPRTFDAPTFWQFGRDVEDRHEEQFGAIVDPGQDEVFLPYPVTGRVSVRSMFPRVCERVELTGLNFDQSERGNADANLLTFRARDVRVRGLRGRVTAGMNVTDTERFSAEDVDVELLHTHPNAGRALACWGSRDVSVDRVAVRSSKKMFWDGGRSGGPMFSLENYTRGVRVNDLRVRWDDAGAAWGTNQPVFAQYGNSAGLVVPTMTVDDAGSCHFWNGRLGDDSQWPRFGTIRVARGDLREVDYFVGQGTRPVWERLVRPSADGSV